ncbi:MAG: M16 family metallopeptidase, partial [Steroidobacteraceae bacterium]
SEVPQAPDPKELLAGYQGKAAIAAGEEFDPSPSNILARTRSEALPGGAQLSLLSKTTRGNEVTATLTLRLGSLDSLRGKASVASFTAAMLRRGTTSRSLQQLNDELDRLKSSVSIGGSGQTVSVSLLSTRDNLLPTLELVTDMLRNPAFPEGEFTKLRDEWLASIEQSRSDPQSLAIRELSQRLSPYPEGDFRRTLSFDDEKAELMAVELTDLKQFHADYYGATRATAAVVGDFEETTTRAALGALLANWQAPMKFERASERFFDVPGAETQILTPDKANAFMVAQLNLPLRDDHPDYPALVIANYMLGGGFLNSRLAVRIRQQEGISYGVGSFLNASPLDEDGSFGVFAIYNPENSARLLAALREELAKVIATGFSANELRDAQTGWLQGRNLSRSQDRELMGRLASYLYLQRTLEWDQDFEQRVAALTADEVQAAFVRWITPESLSIIEAGDFATASAQP